MQVFVHGDSENEVRTLVTSMVGAGSTDDCVYAEEGTTVKATVFLTTTMEFVTLKKLQDVLKN